MSSRNGRSRSPTKTCSGWTSEELADAIVALAQEPDQRPEALQLLDNGNFRLEDLMRTWASERNLTEQEVLKAVRAHMFYKGSCRLRFALNSDSSARIIIRVMNCKTTARVAVDAPSLSGAATPSRCSGTRLEESGITGETHQTNGFPRMQTSANTDFIDRVLKEAAEMSDAPETRAAPEWRPRSNPRLHRDDRDRCRSRDHGRSRDRGRSGIDEKIQRWVNYVLKRGHGELSIFVDPDGWALIDEVAHAMSRQRSGWGTLPRDGLRSVLTAPSAGGRFEVDELRVRHLPRHMRQQNNGSRPRGPVVSVDFAPPAPPNFPPPPNLLPQSAARPPEQAQTQYLRHTLPEMSLASAGKKSFRLAHDRHPSSAYHGEVASMHRFDGANPFDDPTKPPLQPPGPHWTQYVDGDSYWWHYEGPLGSWWCSSETERPMRYLT